MEYNLELCKWKMTLGPYTILGPWVAMPILLYKKVNESQCIFSAMLQGIVYFDAYLS